MRKSKATGKADPPRRNLMASLKALGAERETLKRQGKLDKAALNRVDGQSREEFERMRDGLVRRIAEIDTRYSPFGILDLPKPLTTAIAAGLLFVCAGAALEASLGKAFVFAFANEYRAASPWIFAAFVAVFGAFWLWLESKPEFRIRYPTTLLRRFVIVPIFTALGAGGAVASPLGWMALVGWTIGQSHTVQATIVSMHKPAPNSRACKQDANVEIRGATADICLDGRIAGVAPVNGEVVAVSGRISMFGVYVEEIRAR